MMNVAILNIKDCQSYFGLQRNLYAESLLKDNALPSVDSKNLYRLGKPLNTEEIGTFKMVNASAPERFSNLALRKRELIPM